MDIDPHARLAELGLTLPPVPAPLASYVPVRAVDLGDGGTLLYVSGQVATRDGRPVHQGCVPGAVSFETAQENARLCVLNVLAQVEAAAGLGRVEQVVQLSGFVQSDDGFHDQHRVINAASDLLQQVLGDAGRHSRVAVGVNALPLDVPVEISAVVLVRGGAADPG